MTGEEAILHSACLTLCPDDEAIVFVDRATVSAEAFEHMEPTPMSGLLTVVFVDVPPGKTVRDCVTFAKGSGKQ